MAVQIYMYTQNLSSSVEKNIYTSEGNEQVKIFEQEKRKFRSPNDHVIVFLL